MSKTYKFPKDFFWGAATASYQVEGGIYNNDWAKAAEDGFVPLAGSGGDHYKQYESDFDLAKSIGHNCHRLSIEWSRIEPEEGKFDMKEIEHYRKVLQSLNEKGLTPFVTLWHFTLPLWFVEKKGFEKKENIKYFSRYCEFVVKNLKEECKHWATCNEPMVFASNGWLRGQWPPFKIGRFLMIWTVVNNLAKAHRHTYKILKKESPDSDIGVVKNNIYFHVHKGFFNKFRARFMDWFWNRRFLKKVDRHCDSLGINYYFHSEYGNGEKKYPKSDMGWDLYPEGLYHVLMGVKGFGKGVYVSEAGLADERDKNRAWYIRGLVESMGRALEDGVKLEGYMYWSLMDNYEWSFGFEKRFGLIEIDYNTKERRIRNSAYEFEKICRSGELVVK